MRTLTSAAQTALDANYAVEPITVIEIEWTSPTDVPGVNSPATLWDATDAPVVVDSNDGAAVEVGVQFTSQTNGFITGVRFYKATANTGTHVGKLWTSTGTLLAQVTFTSETASGWQQTLFSSPVAITSDTVYVVSYHTTVGHYSADQFYFSIPRQSNPLITTLQAGVFQYGSGGFPTNVFDASNYWVDPIFQATAVLPPPIPISSTRFADQDIPGVEGAILELTGLDAVINETGQDLSQSMQITLNDTDGSIKARMDTINLHKRPVVVYQYLKGTTYPDDMYVIFKGLVNSPLEWDEGQRTVKFSIVSRLENVEVGFFIEGGQFPDIDPSLIGKSWPLAFGTVVNMPALQISKGIWGELLQGTGIKAVDLDCQLTAARAAQCPIIGYYGGTPMNDPSCLQNRCVQVAALELAQQQQEALESGTLLIQNGELFPQGQTISIQINKAIYTGQFSGQTFFVYDRIHPDFTFSLPSLATVSDNECGAEVLINNNGFGVPVIRNASMGNGVFCHDDIPVTTSGFFWAEAGAQVTLQPAQPLIYILNIIPSTILQVCARYTTEAGQLVMATIPSDFYTIRESNYGAYQMMELVLNRQLSLTDPRWQDDIFVSLKSDVGPNTVDILQWFINKYTAFQCDDTSFGHVRELVDTYPSNFALLDNKNIIDVLREIAYQARCALWLRGDTFFIRYLPETPDSVDTISHDDIDTKSLKLVHTQTEELITKLTATWRQDLSISSPNTMILRNNVEVYGLQEGSTDFYIYNIQDYVYKAATYWLLRRSNIWRRAIFSTAMHKIPLEVLDGITLDIPELAPTTITSIVEKATYNWSSNTVDFECWTPMISGTLTPYVYIYTANLDAEVQIPDPVFTGVVPPAFRTLVPLQTAPSVSGLSTGASVACGGNPVVGYVGGEDGGAQTPVCQKDKPKKKPSDENDEKKDPSTGGGAGAPDSSSSQAGTDAINRAGIAQNALAAAQAYNANATNNAAAAQQGGGGGGGAGDQNAGNKPGSKPSDNMKDLPTKCPPCSSTVVFSWFNTVPIEDGAAGTVCVPENAPVTETFCFGSASSAATFAGANGSKSIIGNCNGRPPCGICGDYQMTPGGGCQTTDGMNGHNIGGKSGGTSILDLIASGKPAA